MIVASVIGIIVALILTLSNESSLASEQKQDQPVVHDNTLTVELVAEGLESPTSMGFLDEKNILVLQKNDGQVRLVSNGNLRNEPVMLFNVTSEAERGLLGIAIWNNDDYTNKNNTIIYLYMTEDNLGVRNKVYQFEFDWNSMTLLNPKSILDLPGEPGPYHNGGKIMVGPYDGHLYAVIGDVNAGGGKLDNQIPGRDLDDKSVVLRVDRETGLPVSDNPFYNSSGSLIKLKKYFAYGIRNSFGMDFDPISHLLWMTEDGPDRYDEINIVKPGFNSGWHKIIGPAARNNATIQNDLVIFDNATYKDPVFSWYTPVGVTDIEFFSSSMLGSKYENNIFVGDINNGYLYFFEVNENRTGLKFSDSRLLDLVADPVREKSLYGELSSIIFGERFGRITDIETGPDGYLYVLTYEDGRIYRIINNEPS